MAEHSAFHNHEVQWYPSSDRSMEELRQIEEMLLWELAETRREYLAATEQSERRIAIKEDVGYGRADGSAALKYSTRRQRAAISAYSKSIRAFNDFILHGRVPQSSPDLAEDDLNCLWSAVPAAG